MDFVETDGVKLAYETTGRGDPPIIFVHGWSCDRSYFQPQFDHFATTHAVATVDLRGHGDSDKPVPESGVYEVEVFADDVLGVARAIGLERPVIVGHSLGGLIALECASRADAVRAAVMVDPAPITNEGVKAYFRDSFDACAADDDGSWRKAFAGNLFMATDVARRGDIVRGMASGPPRIAAHVMLAMGTYAGPAALEKVRVPLLSIGSASPTNPSSELQAACPAIWIGQTVGAGHFNHLEVPEQVTPMIERFLSTTSAL